MKIVYISKLNGNPWAGPSYSIPSQISSQNQIDDVYWFNLMEPSSSISDGWLALGYYYDYRKTSIKRLNDIIAISGVPNIFIIEQFYAFFNEIVVKEIVNSSIPYVIIPRGELTSKAQSIKKIKKSIANYLFFNKLASKATAIQYLTVNESEDSGMKWNRNKIIIPNGIRDSVNKLIINNAKIDIRIVSIGRIDMYHKGLDLLIAACSNLKEKLMTTNCKIDLYGPCANGDIAYIESMIEQSGLSDIISINGPVYGIEKETVLLNSTLFIMTSRFEGHPMALIEAMNYGLPCIVTEGSNMRSEVEQYDAGWGADNTISSIEAAILKALNSRNDYSSYSINAIRLSKEYEWDKLALISHDEYQKLIHSTNC